jgi:hypothetical protein
LNNALIHYWKTGSHYRQPQDKLTFISQAQAKSGIITLQPPTPTTQYIWIAPFVLTNEQNQHFVPLLLPGMYQKGNIALPTTPLLPWFADNLVQDFQDWCLNVFFDEEQVCTFSTWQAYYEACIEMLDLQNLKEKGWNLLPQSAYFWQVSSEKPFSPLLRNYACIEIKEEAIEEESFDEERHLFCASNGNRPRLTQNEIDCVMKALSLPKGHCLAIETPCGSNQESLIDAIAGSKMAHALVNGAALPTIYRLSKDNLKVFMSAESILLDKLIECYQDLLSGINLEEKRAIAKDQEDALDEEIALLQSHDECEEKKLEEVYAAQQAVSKQKKSFKQRWLSIFHKPSCEHSEKIRQIKVQRTKIHQQLVEVIEQKSLYRQADQHWREWCDRHAVTPSADAQQIMAQKLFSLLDSQWENIEGLGSDSKGDHILIIEEADQRLPCEMIAWLEEVDCAIFMGNPQEYYQGSRLDSMVCQQLLAASQVDSDEYYDDLHYKGMLLSTGNAWQVAFHNQFYRTPSVLYEVDSKHPAIVAYCNLFHRKKLQSNNFINNDVQYEGIHLLPVEGQHYSQQGEDVNPTEAKAIFDLVQSWQAWLKGETIAIVSFFPHQVMLLQKLFREVQYPVNVIAYQDLSEQCWDYVLFSTVLTKADPRPYIFDQNDTFFYSLTVRAKRGLWIAGQKALFNPKMHSPSGKLAKQQLEQLHLEQLYVL